MVAMQSINQKIPVWLCGVVVVLLPIIIPPKVVLGYQNPPGLVVAWWCGGGVVFLTLYNTTLRLHKVTLGCGNFIIFLFRSLFTGVVIFNPFSVSITFLDKCTFIK